MTRKGIQGRLRISLRRNRKSWIREYILEERSAGKPAALWFPRSRVFGTGLISTGTSREYLVLITAAPGRWNTQATQTAWSSWRSTNKQVRYEIHRVWANRRSIIGGRQRTVNRGINSRRQTHFQNGPEKMAVFFASRRTTRRFRTRFFFPVKLFRLRRTLGWSLRRGIDGAKIRLVIIRVHGRLDARILFVHFPAEYFAGDFVFDLIQQQGLTAFHFVNHKAGRHGFHLGCGAGRKRKDLLFLFRRKLPLSP